MVIADINILCVHPRKKIDSLINNAQIDCYNLNKDNRDFFYNNRYLMLSEMEGFLYQIYPKARDEWNYEQEFMDLLVENDEYKVIFIDDIFKSKLIDLMFELYFYSLSEGLYFFVDLQGYKEKYIELKWTEFLKKIQNSDISFNTIYYISNI